MRRSACARGGLEIINMPPTVARAKKYFIAAAARARPSVRPSVRQSVRPSVRPVGCRSRKKHRACISSADGRWRGATSRRISATPRLNDDRQRGTIPAMSGNALACALGGVCLCLAFLRSPFRRQTTATCLFLMMFLLIEGPLSLCCDRRRRRLGYLSDSRWGAILPRPQPSVRPAVQAPEQR